MSNKQKTANEIIREFKSPAAIAALSMDELQKFSDQIQDELWRRNENARVNDNSRMIGKCYKCIVNWGSADENLWEYTKLTRIDYRGILYGISFDDNGKDSMTLSYGVIGVAALQEEISAAEFDAAYNKFHSTVLALIRQVKFGSA